MPKRDSGSAFLSKSATYTSRPSKIANLYKGLPLFSSKLLSTNERLPPYSVVYN